VESERARASFKGSMHIAVIGAGNIGATLARKWRAAGHEVVIGARDPSKDEVRQLAIELGGEAHATTIPEAVRDADAVLFAVPGNAMQATASALGNALDGKLVFDATNNIGAGVLNSVDALVAASPQAVVYRAFNIYGFENFADPQLQGTQADLFFAGPDGDGRARAEQLIADVGLNPVWLGGADHAELVDQFMRVWFALAFEQKKGRRLAFKLLAD
jgi:predicted dinucleotide-binding enzyme